MKGKPYQKLFVIALVILGGILFFCFLSAGQVKAQTTWKCTCVSGPGGTQASTNIGDTPSDYAPYSSAMVFCTNWCAAYLGVSSFSSVVGNGSGSGATTCQYSSDCNSDQSCINGTCQSTNGTSGATTCEYNSDCNSDQSCINGTCQSNGSGSGSGTTGGGDCRTTGCSSGTCTSDSGIWSCTGAGGTGGSTDQSLMPSGPIGGTKIPNWLGVSSISDLILNIVNFLINVIALPFAVLMIILAGFRFATAQGNEEKLKKARQNFIWTIVGVGVVLAAKILVTYIQELMGGTGNTLNDFITKIRGTLNLVIGVLFALVTVYFIWGVIQYVEAGGDEQKLTQGKRHMVWGIIGMAIMGAAWGIVSIIKQYITGSW